MPENRAQGTNTLGSIVQIPSIYKLELSVWTITSLLNPFLPHTQTLAY